MSGTIQLIHCLPARRRKAISDMPQEYLLVVQFFGGAYRPRPFSRPSIGPERHIWHPGHKSIASLAGHWDKRSNNGRPPLDRRFGGHRPSPHGSYQSVLFLRRKTRKPVINTGRSAISHPRGPIPQQVQQLASARQRVLDPTLASAIGFARLRLGSCPARRFKRSISAPAARIQVFSASRSLAR